MKKLELGVSKVFKRDQREMLLDMCLHYISDDGLINFYWTENEEVGFVSSGNSVNIPWLEVCMLHLPKAMANVNNRPYDISVRLAYHLHDFYHHPKHPIDHLYQEYKDHTAWIKKNK